MTRSALRIGVAGGVACALLAGTIGMTSAIAQDFRLRPAFGSIQLEAGFLPDPYRRNLTAGGTIRAQDRFRDCRGYIANAPDFSLYYSAGSAPLYINVDSDRDTTLVVNGPDGRWYCDDDGADAPFNPLLQWNNPQSGRYDIWVGTYSRGSGVPATLFISELGEATNDGGLAIDNSRYVDISAPALSGNIRLNGGFLPDPVMRNVPAGGNLRANDAIASSCRGYVETAPTLELSYSGSGPLYIYTEGNADTTLAINGPDGRWHCADDTIGTDAGIEFRSNTSGVYDIYVGTYGQSRANTRLMISEIRMGYSPGGK